MDFKRKSLILALTMLAGNQAYAAVSADEASQLGSELTPWGAIKDGNAEGTIPAYSGRPTPPANYDSSTPGIRPDLFGDEKPVVVITAQNMAEHADKLSEGTQAMLKKYPEYRVDVYPTHRTANYPDWADANSIKNATDCRTTDGGLGIENCHAGVPFPIPQSGYEVMWNKILQLDSPSSYGVVRSLFVDPTGKVILQGQNQQSVEIPYWDKDRTKVMGGKDIYWLYRHISTAPARKAGEGLLMHDSLDMVNTGRRAWQYIPGQRRVKLSPDIAYDTPNPQSGGTSNMDDATLFLGAMDRFEFKLIGKREMYIPYNAFKLKDAKQCPQDTTMLKGVVNPDCMRWELHRVWEVEATLRQGSRHNYSKRRFFMDEDVFSGLAENYDASGQLYRVVQTTMTPRYESIGHDLYTTINYDMPSGAYVLFSYSAQTGGSTDAPKQPARFWSPDSLSGSSVR